LMPQIRRRIMKNCLGWNGSKLEPLQITPDQFKKALFNMTWADDSDDSPNSPSQQKEDSTKEGHNSFTPFTQFAQDIPYPGEPDMSSSSSSSSYIHNEQERNARTGYDAGDEVDVAQSLLEMDHFAPSDFVDSEAEQETAQTTPKTPARGNRSNGKRASTAKRSLKLSAEAKAFEQAQRKKKKEMQIAKSVEESRAKRVKRKITEMLGNGTDDETEEEIIEDSEEEEEVKVEKVETVVRASNTSEARTIEAAARGPVSVSSSKLGNKFAWKSVQLQQQSGTANGATFLASFPKRINSYLAIRGPAVELNDPHLMTLIFQFPTPNEKGMVKQFWSVSRTVYLSLSRLCQALWEGLDEESRALEFVPSLKVDDTSQDYVLECFADTGVEHFSPLTGDTWKRPIQIRTVGEAGESPRAMDLFDLSRGDVCCGLLTLPYAFKSRNQAGPKFVLTQALVVGKNQEMAERHQTNDFQLEFHSAIPLSQKPKVERKRVAPTPAAEGFQPGAGN